MIYFGKFDKHAYVHALGCYCLTAIIAAGFNGDMVVGAGIALALGIAWELLDLIFSLVRPLLIRLHVNIGTLNSIFDPKGMDVLDIIFWDLGGCLLAMASIWWVRFVAGWFV